MSPDARYSLRRGLDVREELPVGSDNPQPGMQAAIVGPDWEFKDWRRFSRFQMDVMLVAETVQEVGVGLMDEVGSGHRHAPIFLGTISPDAPVHVSYDIDPESPRDQEQRQPDSFTGPFRVGEVSLLYINLPHPEGRPVTLYIDNLRLTPRTREEVPPADASRPPPRGAP